MFFWEDIKLNVLLFCEEIVTSTIMDSSLSVRSVHNTINSSASTSKNSFCFMIHYMPSVESLDPRIKDIYKGMRPHVTPKYGLGYTEQCDIVILDCRFTNPLPKGIQIPFVDEIHKFHTVMKGCQKGSIPKEWIKKMLN